MGRIDFLSNIAVSVTSGIVKSKYNIGIKNEHFLDDYADKGFVLLPKHQSNWDIILEGMLLKETIGRYGHYVMKDSLPKFFEYLGGIPVLRARDLLKIKDKEERRAYTLAAREKSNRKDEMVINLLANEEIYVCHVEGKRYYQQSSKIPLKNINALLNIQKEVGRPIPFIPLDIKYEDLNKSGSSIILSVGKPITVPDDGLDMLANHLVSEIELLER